MNPGPSTRPSARAVARAVIVAAVLTVGALVWASRTNDGAVGTTNRAGTAPTDTRTDPRTDTRTDTTVASNATPPLTVNPPTTLATTTQATTSPAPTGDPTDPTAAPTSDPDARSVQIVDFAFEPASMTVAVGTTVRWVNADSFDHSVVSDAASLDSGTISPGDDFTATMSTVGEHSYICGIHPFMTGTLVVTD